MNLVLLLGAGFSRNWGGWLAQEALEYLVGCSELDESIRELLWSHQRKGGFEAALAELQQDSIRQRSGVDDQRLARFQAAIHSMFEEMNTGFADTRFEFQQDIKFLVRTFLERFDAIFTLNQDLLLETHYLDGNVQLAANRKWQGWHIPGMRLVEHPESPLVNRAHGRWAPDSSKFNVSPKLQPYFKLHGSTNWFDSSSKELLVMGGGKLDRIRHHPVLEWMNGKFTEYLSRSETRLMIIGYGFRDSHINVQIRDAAQGGRLRLFIVDPQGTEVIDPNRDALAYRPDELTKALRSCLRGASRRPLRDIFGGDQIEHRKVMRFFQ